MGRSTREVPIEFEIYLIIKISDGTERIAASGRALSLKMNAKRNARPKSVIDDVDDGVVECSWW
jgi:hypothetical protein